jgi:hypothetical protein
MQNEIHFATPSFGATMEYTYFRVDVAKAENHIIKLCTTVPRKRKKFMRPILLACCTTTAVCNDCSSHMQPFPRLS